MILTRKLILPALTVFAVLLAGIFAYTFKSLHDVYHQAEEGDLVSYSEAFVAELENQKGVALALASATASNASIQQAFAERDRQKLIALNLPSFEMLKEYKITQYQFHLPNGARFLSLNDLNNQEDAGFLAVVELANTEQRPVAGLESENGKLGIRAAVPIYYQGKHIGTVEFGVGFNDALLIGLKEKYGGEWNILLSQDLLAGASHQQIAGGKTPVPSLVLYATTQDNLLFHDESSYVRALNGETAITHPSIDGRAYAILTSPLYDFSGRSVGALDIVYDHTHISHAENNRLLLVGLVSVLALVFGSLSLVVFTSRTLQPIRTLTTAAAEITESNITGFVGLKPSADEIGTLATAFNRMTMQLRNSIANLENRVADRTAELSQANEQLQVELAERKRAEEKLVYTALHDPLTNLPNRVLFMDRLHHAMERVKRHRDDKFVVLFLDLDRFKVVNDSLGHNIGDLLLIESAQRLAACLRSQDTVARLGGDEFVILLEDIQDTMDATLVVDRIQYDLALPYVLEGHKVFVSVSMGIVLSEARYERPEDILRDADIAMYRAKGQGRGRYEMFDMEMLDRAMTRLELESDLRKAVEHQEFVIHYQPIIELGIRQIIGFEALVRWQHPTRGLVSPAEFIPMAEETGLIVPIGQWVLTEACHQIREWQVQFPADPPLTVSVNLSVRQCAQTDLVQRVAEVLQSTGLDASSLKLELTESMIVEDAKSTSDMLSELRALGVQVQIDDFGTGYSSLDYLQKLPIDTLKIDRTFVNRLGKDGSGFEIVRTILALAHDLRMKVVAEGIETEDQLSKLKSMQCEYGQGYLFNKPIDSQAAGILLAESLARVVG